MLSFESSHMWTHLSLSKHIDAKGFPHFSHRKTCPRGIPGTISTVPVGWSCMIPSIRVQTICGSGNGRSDLSKAIANRNRQRLHDHCLMNTENDSKQTISLQKFP